MEDTTFLGVAMNTATKCLLDAIDDAITNAPVSDAGLFDLAQAINNFAEVEARLLLKMKLNMQQRLLRTV